MQTATILKTETDLEGIFRRSKIAANTLRALNNSFRQRILSYLSKYPGSNVTAIYGGLRMEQSVASSHLAILRREGIVTAKREGKNIRYFLNTERLQQIDKTAKAL